MKSGRIKLKNPNKVWRKIFGVFEVGDRIRTSSKGICRFLDNQEGTIIGKMGEHKNSKYYLIRFDKLPDTISIFSIRRERLELLECG